MPTITISGRGLGRKHKALFDDFSVPLPPDLGEGGGLTLRELITRVVLAEVEAFRLRQEKRRLTRVLSPAQIDEGLAKGKVESGGSEIDQKVDDDDAVATALQGFEDGLYLVVIDGVEHRDLDAQVYVQAGSRVTFIRLVFLAGA
jgi:hypothetical protein